METEIDEETEDNWFITSKYDLLLNLIKFSILITFRQTIIYLLQIFLCILKEYKTLFFEKQFHYELDYNPHIRQKIGKFY